MQLTCHWPIINWSINAKCTCSSLACSTNTWLFTLLYELDCNQYIPWHILEWSVFSVYNY